MLSPRPLALPSSRLPASPPGLARYTIVGTHAALEALRLTLETLHQQEQQQQPSPLPPPQPLPLAAAGPSGKEEDVLDRIFDAEGANCGALVREAARGAARSTVALALAQHRALPQQQETAAVDAGAGADGTSAAAAKFAPGLFAAGAGDLLLSLLDQLWLPPGGQGQGQGQGHKAQDPAPQQPSQGGSRAAARAARAARAAAASAARGAPSAAAAAPAGAGASAASSAATAPASAAPSPSAALVPIAGVDVPFHSSLFAPAVPHLARFVARAIAVATGTLRGSSEPAQASEAAEVGGLVPCVLAFFVCALVVSSSTRCIHRVAFS